MHTAWRVLATRMGTGAPTVERCLPLAALTAAAALHGHTTAGACSAAMPAYRVGRGSACMGAGGTPGVTFSTWVSQLTRLRAHHHHVEKGARLASDVGCATPPACARPGCACRGTNNWLYPLRARSAVTSNTSGYTNGTGTSYGDSYVSDATPVPAPLAKAGGAAPVSGRLRPAPAANGGGCCFRPPVADSDWEYPTGMSPAGAPLQQ